MHFEKGPVTFPDPAGVATVIDGVRVVDLPTLVQLKLALSTGVGRRKDLGDVQELIRHLRLSDTFAEQIDESVRPLYRELWAELQNLPPET
jgi:hypothetical protein